MPSLDMEGDSLPLNDETIDKYVAPNRPGNYALGYVEGDSFYVNYVGRSDDNLNGRLHSWVGKRRSYTRFKRSYATSPKAAFEKECRNYHDFQKTDNDIHPAKPAGTNWKCPVCGQ